MSSFIYESVLRDRDDARSGVSVGSIVSNKYGSQCVKELIKKEPEVNEFLSAKINYVNFVSHVSPKTKQGKIVFGFLDKIDQKKELALRAIDASVRNLQGLKFPSPTASQEEKLKNYYLCLYRSYITIQDCVLSVLYKDLNRESAMAKMSTDYNEIYNELFDEKFSMFEGDGPTYHSKTSKFSYMDKQYTIDHVVELCLRLDNLILTFYDFFSFFLWKDILYCGVFQNDNSEVVKSLRNILESEPPTKYYDHQVPKKYSIN